MKAFFALLFVVALLLFFSAVVAWNVVDIVNRGANFWNVFWLALVVLIATGSVVAGDSK